jgi:hypothetical protein
VPSRDRHSLSPGLPPPQIATGASTLKPEARERAHTESPAWRMADAGHARRSEMYQATTCVEYPKTVCW